jgi:beta-lactamase class A
MAATLLRRVDLGREKLDRRVVYAVSDLVAYSPVTQAHVGGNGMSLAELCDAAVSLSDNSAANFVMRAFDGPAGFTAFFREIGDSVTRLDRWETELNTAVPGNERDTTSPSAMAASVNKLVLGPVLTAKSRHQLTSWLVANKVGDNRLRAGVPQGWLVADKTGTGDQGTANDIGVLFAPSRAPLVVCCYLTEAKAAQPGEREAAIAEVARLAVTLA